MPPALSSSAASRRTLCAACARQVRQASSNGASAPLPASLRLRRAFSSSSASPVRCSVATSAAARRPIYRTALSSQNRPGPLVSRPISQSSRTPTAAARRPCEPSRESASTNPASSSRFASSSSSPASSPSPDAPSSETPLFYALFPRTLSQGPPPKGPFEIDVRTLRTEFLQLQAAAHPDFHHAAASSGASSEEGTDANHHSAARAKAEAASALINEAYRTLASPLLRAQYLLRQRFNIDLAGDEATTLWAGGANGQKNDAELLMAVLEAREGIEGATSEADLEPLREENNARMRASEEALAGAFATDDTVAAQREAVRLRYWVNIDDSLRNWEPGRPIVLEH